MIQRIVTPSKSNSYFLFGARGTGKTTLLRYLYPSETSLFIDLLDPAEEEYKDVKFGKVEDWDFTSSAGQKIKGRIY